MHGNGIADGVSRRQFLIGSALGAGALALPRWARTQPKPKYLRRNLAKPGFPLRVLASYEKAIKAMLALPPTDPRNWYRNAFIHTLDCPHGNWWFVVWHRGYIGWFERICRDLSGDAEFALPYWDWTAEPRVPASFYDGLLNPAHPDYIASYERFYDLFEGPMNDFWSGMSAGQIAEQKYRHYTSMADVWAQVKGNPMFFDPANARALTKAHPDFDPQTQDAVSMSKLEESLAPIDFVDFGSDQALQHSQMVGFATLEQFPHNQVHNDTGGFMGDFLSPVDPVFFAHHANIDRIWDVWTRKQQAQGGPTLPTGADLTAWSKEPFLFYIDEKGQPVARNTAGDYATIGDFDYGYEPGSGEEVVKAARVRSSNTEVAARIEPSVLTPDQDATASVKLPPALRAAALRDGRAAPVYVRVYLRPDDTKAMRYKVLLNAPEGRTDYGPGSPYYAGTLEFFGRHRGHGEAVAFTVPISANLRGLAEADALDAQEPLRVQVVAEPREDAGVAAPLKARLEKLSIGQF